MDSEVVYLNDNDEIVEQEFATKAIIREFDENGNMINETFGFINKNPKPFFDDTDDGMSFEEKMQLADKIESSLKR